MHFLKTTFAVTLLCAAVAVPTLAQDTAARPVSVQVIDPNGSFVDKFGTSFTFTLCGGEGTDLCGVLTNLAGKSATKENLTFVGKQVMQAKQTAPNEWKGSLTAGGISAEATITRTGPDTIDIRGCRAAVLCQTLTYNRAS